MAASLPAQPPEWALVQAHERGLSDAARAAGAHYTPWDAAIGLARRALDAWPGRGTPLVVDPTCGAGSFLLAAAELLAARGADPVDVARSVRGVDLDEAAGRTAREVLTRWLARRVGGTAVTPTVLCADVFAPDLAARLGCRPVDVVVGNPPFQGQLTSRSARSGAERARLVARFGELARGYVDTSALILAAALDLLAPGGSLVLVLPRSFLAARGAAGVRALVAERAALVGVWLPEESVFEAQVDVCAVAAVVGGANRPVEVWGGRHANTEVAAVGSGSLDAGSWSTLAATARGVPRVEPVGAPLATEATVVAGFRDEFYAVAAAVREGDGTPETAPHAVTSGMVGPGRVAWGSRTARIAKRAVERPVVDMADLEAGSPKVAGWARRLLRPKVLVATQTTVIEAAVDVDGLLLPLTPVLSVLGATRSPVELAAAMLAPPASAWAQHRLAGTGRSRRVLRIDAAAVRALPLPTDPGAWADAASLLDAGAPWSVFGTAACAAWGLGAGATGELLDWWLPLVERAGRLDR